MQIFITLENNGVIDLPVNYNYYIQSAIFALLASRDASYAEMLHDEAYGGNSKYKLFTFGCLSGKSSYHNKRLYFDGNICFEIRSISDEFIQILKEAILETGELRLGKFSLGVEKLEICDYIINRPDIKIRTITPIIAKDKTADRKTIYYSPKEVYFIRRVREDFESKYIACCGDLPESSIDILPLTEGKKVVTRYKGTWITAYNGIFQLCGEPRYLQFLYDVGLGAKTSQGFGMFDVIE